MKHLPVAAAPSIATDIAMTKLKVVLLVLNGGILICCVLLFLIPDYKTLSWYRFKILNPSALYPLTEEVGYNMERGVGISGNCTLHLPPWRRGRDTPRVMTYTEWLKTMALMKLLDMVLTGSNVHYMLFGGSLYGSYMCHDMLPWDDDIDIMVDHNQRPKMEHLLKELSPEYTMLNHTSKLFLKFFLTNTPKTWEYEWSWPFIDISFYKENETHVWEHGQSHKLYRTYPKEIVFPLHRRPLGSIWLPCPRDSRAFLMHSIRSENKTFQCGQQGWVHKAETRVEEDHIVDCSGLEHVYPTIYRSSAVGGVRETLRQGSHVFYSCILPEPPAAITVGGFSFDLAKSAISRPLSNGTTPSASSESTPRKATLNITLLVDEWTRAPVEKPNTSSLDWIHVETKAED
ncbi:PREDICTED: uncharacterized protein LOC106811313 [Priapulus caudatus]|uniref:Uncharacterized protein LOC106811313 n=1 Tax=Priapulus caudatus TaxID=37621 RepID=A0ABM1EDV2_PRICU|nr:PREDICTED: uncharacterized protein LOC106811313 [Priapulus caudatus]XP_014670373.1 PREDICTED: uncharacterized protein LOC106811313 [Priapulus caudatus]